MSTAEFSVVASSQYHPNNLIADPNNLYWVLYEGPARFDHPRTGALSTSTKITEKEIVHSYDGTITKEFTCVDCGYKSDGKMKVVAHRSIHGRIKAQAKRAHDSALRKQLFEEDRQIIEEGLRRDLDGVISKWMEKYYPTDPNPQMAKQLDELKQQNADLREELRKVKAENTRMRSKAEEYKDIAPLIKAIRKATS